MGTGAIPPCSSRSRSRGLRTRELLGAAVQGCLRSLRHMDLRICRGLLRHLGGSTRRRLCDLRGCTPDTGDPVDQFRGRWLGCRFRLSRLCRRCRGLLALGSLRRCLRGGGFGVLLLVLLVAGATHRRILNAAVDGTPEEIVVLIVKLGCRCRCRRLGTGARRRFHLIICRLDQGFCAGWGRGRIGGAGGGNRQWGARGYRS